MLATIHHIGYRQNAERWIERIAAIAAQGPFALSYWSQSVRPNVAGGPAKCTVEMPHGTHWCEMGGVAFGAAVLDGLFGLERDLTSTTRSKPRVR